MRKAFPSIYNSNKRIVMTVKFDTDTIRLITFFENLTGAPVKDCLVKNETNTICFVIEEGKVGIAIGKNGASVKHAERIIGKNIKLFEYSKNISQFVKNLIPQATEIKIRDNEGEVVVDIRVEKKNRAIVIGRDGKNLRLFKELLQRNHQIHNIVVR